MFRKLFLLSPLISLTAAVKGYPAQFILVGIAFAMLCITIATFGMAFRFAHSFGTAGAMRFLGRMTSPTAVMIVPATLWNCVAYAVGLGLHRWVL